MSKWETLSRWSSRLGATHLLQSLPKPAGLLVLNYHRIGNPTQTPYDHAPFSASAESFDQQLSWYRRHYSILSLAEAINYLEKPGRRSCLLLTFDDGYLDNYELAFPILRSHGIPATFFLPTSFIGTNHVPWWDTIAYLLRRSPRSSVYLPAPFDRTFVLAPESLPTVIREVLRIYKSSAVQGGARFLQVLQEACGSEFPPATDRLFMDWTEAAAMRAGGMDFASHTHTHELLAKMPVEEQCRELDISRRVLRERLALDSAVLAYPVGSPTAFSTTTTYEALARSGYRAAFSFYGGMNRPGATHRYNILRCPVDFDNSLERLRLQSSLSSLTLKYWN